MICAHVQTWGMLPERALSAKYKALHKADLLQVRKQVHRFYRTC